MKEEENEEKKRKTIGNPIAEQYWKADEREVKELLKNEFNLDAIVDAEDNSIMHILIARTAAEEKFIGILEDLVKI